MVQRAKFEQKEAYLSSEFGESFARRTFGDEVVDSIPRYVRGKRAGQLKGVIRWCRCVEGGWVSMGGRDMHGEAQGYVCSSVNRIVAIQLDSGYYFGERKVYAIKQADIRLSVFQE